VLQVIERAPDAIAIHRQGRFVFVNAALVTGLGYESAEELLGRSILDIVHPDDHELAIRRMKRIYATGAPNPPEEHRLLKRDGSSIVVEIAGITVDWEGGTAVATFARDLTERKRLQTQLMLADRMAALGLLCAGVAHEINNPLAYVTCNVDVLARELPAVLSELRRHAGGQAPLDAHRQRVEELAKMAAMAKEGTDPIRRIVADLRTLSHGDEQRAPVDVRWVLDAAVNLARHEVSRRARLEQEYRDVPLVDACAPRLEQVFLNLLVNAAQAIPPGAPETNIVRITTGTLGGRALVEVSDTGVGLSPDAANRVFDPFFTTKPPGEGVGLGLAICHGIVTDMGGEIAVESEPGAGATFRVLLPASSYT
jgi:two-component system, NtrC family, sensor kinase